MLKCIKAISLVIVLTVLFGFSVTPTYAGSFSDNFNDGNANGWWLGYSLANPANNGNWRVENGELVQDTGFDGVIALLENQQFSDQITTADVKLNDPSGGGGLVFWFQDNNNWTHAIAYPAGGFIELHEHINGVTYGVHYAYPSLVNNTWYNLKVDANSTNGDIKVYLDNNYLFTYTATASIRTGQTGVINGNAGGYFDNFAITSNSIVDPLVNKAQCKNGGWKVYTNPTFKNQGACVSYLESKHQ